MEIETQRIIDAYEEVVDESFKHEFFGTTDTVRSFCIMTAENPMVLSFNREENKEFNDSLERILKSGHYVYRHLNGKYGTKEHSYIILNISVSDAKRLAALYHQQSFVYAFKSDYTDKSRKTKMTYKFFALRDRIVNRSQSEFRRTGKFPEVPENAYVAKDSQNTVVFPSDADKDIFSRKNSFKFLLPFDVMNADESIALEESVASEYDEMMAKIGKEKFDRLLTESLNDETTGKWHWQCRASLHVLTATNLLASKVKRSNDFRHDVVARAGE